MMTFIHYCPSWPACFATCVGLLVFSLLEITSPPQKSYNSKFPNPVNSILELGDRIQHPTDDQPQYGLTFQKHLDVMLRRGNQWKKCLQNETNLASLQPGNLPLLPELPFGEKNQLKLYLCKSSKVAFLHVYKNGGSFAQIMFHKFCQDKVATKCCLCKLTPPSGNEKRHTYAADGSTPTCTTLNMTEFSEYTVYTFARDPASRFASGVYELARRRNKSWIEKNVADRAANVTGNETLILNSIVETISENIRKKFNSLWKVTRRVDGHIYLQSQFLLHYGQPLPNKLYVGRLEHIRRDMPILMQALFNPPADQMQDLYKFIENPKAHKNDHSRIDVEMSDLVNLDHKRFSPSATNVLRELLAVDYNCGAAHDQDFFL
eukprot:m.340493 g.340493  ORF g.340493 m.340493 type:complete len:377 (+) comp19329_c0_seq1:272-1402(+)